MTEPEQVVLTTEMELIKHAIKCLVDKHRAALVMASLAISVDFIGGLIYGAVEHLGFWLSEYWAISTATTVGYGDVTPRTVAGHIVAVVVMLTAIPLFASAFSLLTSGLTAVHVRTSEVRIKEHVEERLQHHLSGPDGSFAAIDNTTIDTDFDDGDNGSPEAKMPFGFRCE